MWLILGVFLSSHHHLHPLCHCSTLRTMDPQPTPTSPLSWGMWTGVASAQSKDRWGGTIGEPWQWERHVVRPSLFNFPYWHPFTPYRRGEPCEEEDTNWPRPHNDQGSALRQWRTPTPRYTTQRRRIVRNARLGNPTTTWEARRSVMQPLDDELGATRW